MRLFSDRDVFLSSGSFAASENLFASLSTGEPSLGQKTAMSKLLRDYLESERGRATRLADAVGISRSYLSDLSTGKKVASVKVLRDISRETGIALPDLMGQSGLSEGAVSAFDPGQKANEIGSLAATVAPGLRRPTYMICSSANRDAGVMAGDLLIIEQGFDAAKLRDGDLVIGRFQDGDDAVSVICTVASPWLIGAGSQLLGKIGVEAGVVGQVKGVLRGAGLTNL